VKAALEANIADCHVTGEGTPQTTGAFEVKNVDTGKVYWSKLESGKYLEVKDMPAVIAAIKADSA
jgi:selT/selW/selH-like putative selenoprotein